MHGFKLSPSVVRPEPRPLLPRARLIGGALIVAAALCSSQARAGDGVQFSSACDRTYVNKKVGDTEQWAITWEIYGNATGNVFKLDGSTPSFIECSLVDEDETNEIFDCYGSPGCSAAPCGGAQWTLIGSSLAIPLSFFLPTGVDPQDPLASCVPVE